MSQNTTDMAAPVAAAVPPSVVDAELVTASVVDEEAHQCAVSTTLTADGTCECLAAVEAVDTDSEEKPVIGKKRPRESDRDDETEPLTPADADTKSEDGVDGAAESAEDVESAGKGTSTEEVSTNRVEEAAEVPAGDGASSRTSCVEAGTPTPPPPQGKEDPAVAEKMSATDLAEA